MAQFEPDRFDDIPAELGRVGAHRARRSRRGVYVATAWAALASGVLVVAGLYGLSLITDRVTFEIPSFDTAEPEPDLAPEPEPEPEPSVEPITDPSLVELPADFTITILNGAGVEGLGRSASDLLTPLGWPVGTVTAAAQSDLTETIVFYSDPALEAVALGMTVILGVGSVELSDAFPGAPITITVGADFAAASSG